jgi:hypothetical protein
VLASKLELRMPKKNFEYIKRGNCGGFGPHAGEITLRGETDFTLSAELDRWDSQGIKFIFGWMLILK